MAVKIPPQGKCNSNFTRYQGSVPNHSRGSCTCQRSIGGILHPKGRLLKPFDVKGHTGAGLPFLPSNVEPFHNLRTVTGTKWLLYSPVLVHQPFQCDHDVWQTEFGLLTILRSWASSQVGVHTKTETTSEILSGANWSPTNSRVSSKRNLLLKKETMVVWICYFLMI